MDIFYLILLDFLPKIIKTIKTYYYERKNENNVRKW